MSDTAVTVQSVINNSIARGRDEEKTQWTDAQLLKFINKGYDFVHKLLITIRSELAITSIGVTMTDNQEFSLASCLPDFWAMAYEGVFFDGEDEVLSPITFQEARAEGSTTTDLAPTMYYVTASMLGVVPIPSEDSVAAYPTLTCRYFKQNTALTLTDNMPYKNILNEPLSAFMDNLAVLKNQNVTAEFAQIYNTLEQSALTIINSRVPT